MSAVPLRAVMDDAEYDRERQKLQAAYGDPDATPEDLVAKRDQGFAELFYSSGWRQEQLAEKEGKSQPWIAVRLRFGRFLAYATSITAVIIVTDKPLTEWRFRGYWERTSEHKGDEAARFDMVIQLMTEPAAEREAKPVSTRLEPGGKIEQARAFVRPFVEAGASVNPQQLAKEHGFAEGTIQRATERERGRLEGLQEAAAASAARGAQPAPAADPEPPPDPPAEPSNVVALDTSILSKSAHEKFAALERRLRTNLESHFNNRVSAEVTRHIEEYILPVYKDRLERAEILLKHVKPLTRDEYRHLLAALHPDNQNMEWRLQAFEMVKRKGIVLRPEERSRPFTSTLPKTVEELLAMKKTGKGKPAKP